MDNKGKNTYLACFRYKMMVLVFADSKFLRNLPPRGKPVLVTVEQIFIGLAQEEIKHIIQKVFFR